MKIKLLLFLSLLTSAHSIAQTSYTWNGSVSTAWNTAANWTPSGVPAAADHITIVTGSNNCILNAAATVTNITITSGTLNLGGFTLTAQGNGVFTAGTVSNGTLTINASTSATATLTNTAFTTAILNVTTGAITINGGTYGRPVTMNQTGAVQTSGTGNATFSSSLSVTNSGSNNFRINGNCTFNGAVTYINSGSGYLLPELNTGNTYNSTVTLNNTSSSGNLRMCYQGTTNFNGNITVSNTSTGTVIFGEQATAIANLNSGFTITVGGAGFTDGRLTLYRFRQLGTTAQTLALTGTSAIQLLTGCIFNGPLTVTTPTFYLSQATYNGAVTFNKTGSTNDATSGGNIFNNTLTVNHTGSGYWSFGNGSADVYNGDVYANNTGTERIIFAHNSPANQFNGNVYVSQSGTGVGIALGWTSSSSTTVVMAAGKNIFVGAGGFTAGYLQMYHLQQSDATPINLVTTGTSSIISYQCTFTGTVNLTAPDLYPYGGTYNAAATFTKTGGGGGNHNNGFQNIFNSTLTVNQQSSTGYFLLGYNSNDLFNDNIIVNSTASGGISFGWGGGTGTPTLAAGKTILVGGSGFSAGYLQLGTFTELGTAPITLALTGTASFYVSNSAGPCVFGGPVDITAPDIYIRGGTFNGAAAFTRTGVNGDHNNGFQNIFNSTCTINNQGTGGYFMLGYNSNDQFNDNIIVTSTGTGGISLGWTSGTGTPTLAAGKTIQIGGAGFSSGYLQLGSFTELGTAPITLNMTGAEFYVVNANGPSIFGGALDVTAGDLYIRGGTFNGNTSFTKIAGTNDHNNGFQNIFNAPLAINQQSSSGYFMLGYNANDQFNDNISVTSTGTGGIYLGWSGGGTGYPVLAAGKTILVGPAGFSQGFLQFNQFTQLGSAPVNLTFTGTNTYLLFARNSTFGGNFTCTSPSIYFNGATFNGTLNATKTGANGDGSAGNNTFNGIASFTNAGAGYMVLGNSGPDTWNSDVTFINTGTERLLPAWNSAGNVFNGNITVSATGSAQGINFCGNAVSTATLAAGKTVITGTYNSGYLIMQRFTQLGSAPVNLLLSPGASYIQYGPSSSFGGNVISSSPRLYFNGCTFLGTTACTKTGAVDDDSNGSNVYTGVSVMTNSGSGRLLFGNINSDVFVSDVTFNNIGTAYMYVAHNSAGNVFNGNVTINNAPSGSSGFISMDQYGYTTNYNGNIIVTSTSGAGVYFGANTGAGVLASGKTITVGAAGFSSGTLLLKSFTQSGSTAQSLTLTGTATMLQYGPASSFDGNVTSVSPNVLFNGCTFNGTGNFTKNNSGNNSSTGGNIFNGVSIFTNTGSGYLLLGNSSPDTWNADVTFSNSGAERILPCWTAAGNQFNGNITLNSTGSSVGINFCGNTSATATLAAGKNISTGTCNAGYLILQRFTQNGSAANALTITSPGTYIQFGPSSQFGGNVTTSSPGIYFNGCVFNGTVSSVKTGTSNDGSTGGNVFNGSTVLTDNSTGYFLMANTSADAYNADVTFVQNTTGTVYPNYNTNCTYSGNVTVTSPSSTAITFGTNSSGVATFTGTAAQIISRTAGSAVPVFTRLVMNKPSADVTLNTRINISSVLTMTSGIINTSAASILNMNNASSTSVGNAASYINGPMNYDMAASGTRTLNFPIGKASDWRPAVLALSHSTSTSYTYNAEVFNADATTLNWTLPVTVDTVSFMHYWDINRYTTGTTTSVPSTGLSGNQQITLYFGTNDGVRDGNYLTVCKNTSAAPTSWIDIGGTGAPAYAGGTNLSGSVTSTSSPSAFTSFSRFTLGSRLLGWNPLPIELLQFDAVQDNGQVALTWSTASETNNSYFDIERTKDGSTFEFVASVNAYGTGTSTHTQYYSATDAQPYEGTSYYRLKQTDKDGRYVYSPLRAVDFTAASLFSVYPNPSSGQLMLNVSANYINTTMRIFNAQGEQVDARILTGLNNTVDLSALASGVYYIAAGQKREKVVIQK